MLAASVLGLIAGCDEETIDDGDRVRDAVGPDAGPAGEAGSDRDGSSAGEASDGTGDDPTGDDGGESNLDGPPGDPPDTSCADGREARVIALTNEARREEGRAALSCDEGLAELARAHSADMCRRDYFAHRTPDGLSPGDRMSAAGLSFRTVGENIAWGQETAAEVHQSWMSSPGHRQNILSGAYGRIGVGYAACPSARRHLWTQVFAN